MALPAIYLLLPSKFDRAYGDQEPDVYNGKKVHVSGNLLSLRIHRAKALVSETWAGQLVPLGALPGINTQIAIFQNQASQEKQALLQALESVETEQPDWTPKESDEDTLKEICDLLSTALGCVPEIGSILSGSLDKVVELKYDSENARQKRYLDQSFAELHQSINKSADRVIDAVNGMFTTEVLADAAAHIQGVKELLRRYRTEVFEWDETNRKSYARTQDMVNFLHDEIYKPSDSLQSWVLKLDRRMTVENFEDVFPVLADILALQIQCYVFLINIQLQRGLAAAAYSEKVGDSVNNREATVHTAKEDAKFFNQDAATLISDLLDLRGNRARMINSRADILVREREAAIRKPIYVERPGKVKNVDVTQYIWQIRDTYSGRLWEVTSDEEGSSYAGKEHFVEYGEKIAIAEHEWLQKAASAVLSSKVEKMRKFRQRLQEGIEQTAFDGMDVQGLISEE